MATWISTCELSELLGQDATRVLTRNKGGLSVYIPHYVTPDHILAKLIGWPGAHTLSSEYGGEYIIVPNGRNEPQKGKIIRMLQQGKSRRQIAEQCGVTERYVYMVAEQENSRPKQWTLL